MVKGENYNLKAAHGRKIENYGQKDVRLVAEDGDGNDAHVTLRYQATNVHKPIKSVFETTQFGNLAIFYHDGGEFVHVGPGNIEKARRLFHQLVLSSRRIPFGVKNRQFALRGYHDKFNKTRRMKRGAVNAVGKGRFAPRGGRSLQRLRRH